MLRNFKLTLEYDGSEFAGWQFQPYQRTVQGHLEEQIFKIFKKKIHAIASGRTDTGVHALGQVAHFKADTIMKPSQIQRALNAFLDRDVSVSKVQYVPLDFHAQYSVKNKTYRYTILNRKYPSAYMRNKAYFFPHDLNVSQMRAAAKFIKGTHDFKCFQSASASSKIKNTVRTISRLTVKQEGDLIHIEVTCNGFLYRMVRNIVGALLAVGRGKIDKKLIPEIIKSQNRTLAPATAPSNGLCLVKVRY